MGIGEWILYWLKEDGVFEAAILLAGRAWKARDCIGISNVLSAGDIDLQIGQGKVSTMVGGRVLGLMCI